MFTGIIQAVGEVAAMQPAGGDMRLRIQTGELDLADVQLGDSICTSGTCLTVVELPGDGFWADVSVETLNFTTLGRNEAGFQGKPGKGIDARQSTRRPHCKWSCGRSG